jgi:tetratricopeptide (TPR) repeat protein/capsular polysaccharide biosynthesis protein
MTSESAIKKIKAYIAQNQWNEAIALCTENLKQDVNRIEFYPFLAKAYTQRGRLTEAIAAYQQALGTALNQAEIYAELGLLYSKQQQFVQAAWHYQKAIALNPEWAELQYNLAVVLHQLGDWEQTIAAYRQALQIKPNYPAVYFNLGVLYDRRGELDTAIEHYQRAIDIQPNHIRAYSNLASTLAKQKKYEAAIQVLQQGLQIDPTWSTLHNNLGQIYLLNDQPDRALASFEMAICLDSKMGFAYNNLSKLWQQKGNFKRVVENLKRFIALEPTNVGAVSYLAGILLHQGKKESAIESLRHAIALEPIFVNTYCAKNLQEEPKDLLTRAKVSCAKFITALLEEASKEEVLRYLWQTYTHWGDVLFEYGSIKQAETYYRQALDIKANEVSLYLSLGNCLAKQKRWNAAVGIYQIGLILEPNHGQISFQLAKILENQNSARSAVDYYEQILQAKSYQRGVWQELPQLFPTEDTLSNLPQAIYHHTHDWVRNCRLEDYSYTEIPWEGTVAINSKRLKQAPVPINTEESDRSVIECGGVSCNKCMTKLIEDFQPINLGNRSYQCSFLDYAEITAPLPFVVSIPQGKVWNAPQKNAWIICHGIAVMTPDRYLLGDLSRYYPWFLPPCPYKEKTNHILFELDNLPDLTRLKGKVAVLSGLAGHVYYHWMFDILPRIEFLRLSGIDLQSIDWFVINSIEKPFQKETLSWLEIPLSKVIQSDRTSFIQAEELIVPSFPGYLDWVPYGTIKFLRQTFLPKISLDKARYEQRIYISRGRAKTRQVINEDLVIQCLNEFNFTTVYLEEMSILEQVALFANAKVIVAPHGSGLTNLVFCSPRTIAIELFSPNYVRTDYWMISQQLDLKHYYCLGESFNCPPLRNLMYQNSLTEDILVNISSLELILKAAGIVSG